MKKTATAVILLLFILISPFYGYSGSVAIHAEGTSYANADFMYTVTLPGSMEIEKYPDSSDPVLKLSAPASGLNAAISCERIDEAAFESVREYLDDKSAPDRVVFDEIVNIKNSYLSALEHTYQNQFLYGTLIGTGKESNFKLFKQSTEKLFGVESTAALYNIVAYDTHTVNEATYLSIVVPSFENRTIYTFLFMVKKGQLDGETIASISDILKATKISNLEKQVQPPETVLDATAAKKANEGIFSALGKSDTDHELLINISMGYLLQYPSTFIPYKTNSFMNSLQFNSFKIDPFTVFSIQAEKVEKGYNAIQDKINAVPLTGGQGARIVNGGVKNLAGKSYIYIDYETEKDKDKQYATEFYIQKDSMLYTLKLVSMNTPIAPEAMREFVRISESVELFTPVVRPPMLQTYMNWYKDSQEGYQFTFPSNWKLSVITDPSSAKETLSLKNPAMSSPLQITVQQEELKADLQYNDLVNLTEAATKEYESYFHSSSFPYENYPHTLIASTFNRTDNYVKVIRLINYLDENQRQHFCFSINLIQGTKVHTLFVDLNEYGLAGGQTLDTNLLPVINTIAESFSLKK